MARPRQGPSRGGDDLLARWVPGLAALRTLDGPTALRDVAAGLAVAAVAIPVGLAYAALTGVPAEVGLYASMAPLPAYALFGPSRRLIIGPDAATCTLVAAALTALAMTTPQARAEGAAALALLVGAGCLLAAPLKLGNLANLLSKPVLIGYLAGVGADLLVGQLATLTGVTLHETGVIRMLVELVRRVGEVHWLTLFFALGVLAALEVLKRVAPRAPGAALVVAVAVALSWLLDLRDRGLTVLGPLPAGLPPPHLPDLGEFERMLPAAVGVLLVSFASGIVTARSFAEKVGERVDPNRELEGFGAADLASGLLQGFPVTGADSRTAVNIASGASSPLAAIAAAAAIGLVLAVFTVPLSYLPNAALAAILVSAGLGLIEIPAFRQLARVSRDELLFALVATAGVLWIGPLKGVMIAVGATLLNLLRLAARPRDAVLRRTAAGELVTPRRDPSARPIPGVVVYLFEASVLFMNADYFRSRAMLALDSAADPKWFVLDATPMMHADSAAVDAFAWLKRELDRRGVGLLIGGGHGRFDDVLERSGLAELIGRDRIFETPAEAARAAEARLAGADPKATGEAGQA